jgi:hypothetical protein
MVTRIPDSKAPLTTPLPNPHIPSTFFSLTINREEKRGFKAGQIELPAWSTTPSYFPSPPCEGKEKKKNGQ